MLSSSVSSDESEIGANSNDDAVDGKQVMPYLFVCFEIFFDCYHCLK